MRRTLIGLGLVFALIPGAARAQVYAWDRLPDPRGEFIRLCAPHMVGRSARPESVCSCLHDRALATIADSDLHGALMRGISETGVPSIETAWIPSEKRTRLNATFDIIAAPTMQCLFGPRD